MSVTVTMFAAHGQVLQNVSGNTVIGQAQVTNAANVVSLFPSAIVTNGGTVDITYSNNFRLDAAHTLSLSNTTASTLLKSGVDKTVASGDLTGDVTTSGSLAATVTTPKFNWSGTTGNAAIAANTTYFFQPNNSNATLPTTDASGGTRIPVMRTITLQNFCAVQSAVSGGGKSITYTVMTNGVATGITFAISGNADLVGSDSTHTATLLATSTTPIEIGIKIVSGSGSGTPKI